MLSSWILAAAAATSVAPGPAPSWTTVREWQLVVEHTVSARYRSEMRGAGAVLRSSDAERLRCSFRLTLRSDGGGHEDGAEWSGQGQGSGAGYRRSSEVALGGGQRQESTDRREASGRFRTEGRLQIDLTQGTYSFEVQGEEGMSGTRRVHKAGHSSTFQEKRGCDAGIPDQRLPTRGTVLEGTHTTEEPPTAAPNPGLNAQATRVVTTRWSLHPVGRVRTRLVIEPGPGYETWLPEGSDGPQGVGAVHTVRLRLTDANGTAPRQAASRVRVRLTQVSRERGTSLNWPRHGNTSPDLFFRSQGQEGLVELRDGGQELILEGGRTEWTVPVYANDFGAYGELIAQAELVGGGVAQGERAGSPGHSFLSLPKDDNHNRIADAWEASVRPASADPETDDDDTSQGLERPGDGLSLYEEYRGLRTADHAHRRLDPRVPDLFIVDARRLVLPGDWRAITGIELHHLEWTHLPAGDRLPLDPTTSRKMRRVDHHAGFADGDAAHAVWLNANHGMDDSIIFQGPLRARMSAQDAAESASVYRLGTTIQVGHYDPALAEVEGGDAWAPVNIFASYINFDRLHRIAFHGLQSILQKVADGITAPSEDIGASPAEARSLAQRLWQGDAQIRASMPTYLARIAMHELMHAIGSDHHEPDIHGGSVACLMRYPTDAQEARNLLDGAPAPEVCFAPTCRPRMRLLP
ncbi:hypothetical protein [Inhella gelatinilytica]|uniref:Uncharacterized protein n=1 Tax=Inhella gelatinilytica TaxID=2795030 RepID=A0A931IYG0_9BURK|nr:hypothetical protein [Inhella gelatinilytica]MBH9552136.1 hypothetical protein [Inhella gelatinilytica]